MCRFLISTFCDLHTKAFKKPVPSENHRSIKKGINHILDPHTPPRQKSIIKPGSFHSICLNFSMNESRWTLSSSGLWILPLAFPGLIHDWISLIRSETSWPLRANVWLNTAIRFADLISPVIIASGNKRSGCLQEYWVPRRLEYGTGSGAWRNQCPRDPGKYWHGNTQNYNI